ncbi:MAG TPA: hypothetical protein DDY43_04560 [Synechococcales bacterium UBA10510]|nr:hypothetical protein [Synechococcales bacterium UBA10510]
MAALAELKAISPPWRLEQPDHLAAAALGNGYRARRSMAARAPEAALSSCAESCHGQPGQAIGWR